MTDGRKTSAQDSVRREDKDQRERVARGDVRGCGFQREDEEQRGGTEGEIGGAKAQGDAKAQNESKVQGGAKARNESKTQGGAKAQNESKTQDKNQRRQIAVWLWAAAGLGCWILFLYRLWHLCQYGGVMGHLPYLAAGGLGFLACMALALFPWCRRRKKRLARRRKEGAGGGRCGGRCRAVPAVAWLACFAAATVFYGVRIARTAVPYQGALSWKLEEWMQKREVSLSHSNFLEGGAAGILEDLSAALDLPEELYMANPFQVEFRADGTIQEISVFLYGRDADGETRTYLVDYGGEDGKMTVWLDGYADASYEEDEALTPMLRILEKAGWRELARQWTESQGLDAGQGGDADPSEPGEAEAAEEEAVFAVSLLGRQTFDSPQGLIYVDIGAEETRDSAGDGGVSSAGDGAESSAGNGAGSSGGDSAGSSAGDGAESSAGDGGKSTGEQALAALAGGGQLEAYAVSLSVPAADGSEWETVHYVAQPEYISQEVLDAGRELEQAGEAKAAESWTVDSTDGTMYRFLDESVGWRLTVVDAAAGSRFYILEGTADGGAAWETVNADPFGGAAGVAEGIVFYDENCGIIGLGSASGSFSTLYRTVDGGESFTQIVLPLDTVSQLPKLGQELGYTMQDYDYAGMPEETGGGLRILVSADSSAGSGIWFASDDRGETWVYAGVKE